MYTDYHTMMRTEVKADMYDGENCDQVRKYFNTYCEGDMDSEDHSDDITIHLNDLPPGTLILVRYPCCPDCGIQREDKFEHIGGARLKIVGHEEKCNCGFDWEEWVACEYS